MRNALIFINHFKDVWNQLSPEAQMQFVERIRESAKREGVHAVVGYKLTTPGAILDIWEADKRSILEGFKLKLDELGYRDYFDYVVMYGTRDEDWLQDG